MVVERSSQGCVGARFGAVGFRVEEVMIILGLLLLLLGAVLSIPLLWSAGVIVLIVGLALMIVGRSGRPIGGRAHYW